jgi:hypothetical protein
MPVRCYGLWNLFFYHTCKHNSNIFFDSFLDSFLAFSHLLLYYPYSDVTIKNT